MYYCVHPITKAYTMKTSAATAKPHATSKQTVRRQGRPVAASKSVTIQVRMPAEEAEYFRLKAEQEDRPISNFIRKVLRQAVAGSTSSAA